MTETPTSRKWDRDAKRLCLYLRLVNETTKRLLDLQQKLDEEIQRQYEVPDDSMFWAVMDRAWSGDPSAWVSLRELENMLAKEGFNHRPPSSTEEREPSKFVGEGSNPSAVAISQPDH